MARDRSREGIYVEEPKADAWLALLAITAVATALACVIMWLEWSAR